MLFSHSFLLHRLKTVTAFRLVSFLVLFFFEIFSVLLLFCRSAPCHHHKATRLVDQNKRAQSLMQRGDGVQCGRVLSVVNDRRVVEKSTALESGFVEAV